MKIAVASGKGGTGKTTVSLALALASVPPVTLIDCDVEEPNCQLFLTAKVADSCPIEVTIPRFTAAQCSGCGACVKSCRFRALAGLGTRVLVFPELCHSCGNCLDRCPEHALEAQPFEIGRIDHRSCSFGDLYSGVLKIGHPMAPPLIRELKKLPETHDLTILDAPPGTACPMVTTVQDCDFVVLVTEPTPFGLHDLELAVDTLETLKIPHGIILNRATGQASDDLIVDFARQRQVPLLLKIPFSRAAATGYSQGLPLLQTLPELREQFAALPAKIRELLP